MNKKMFKGKYIVAFTLVMALVLSMAFTFVRTSYASGFTVKLPVKQIFESYSGSDGKLGGEFSYVFEATNTSSTLDGFTLKGNEEKDIECTFQKAGVYEYTLKVTPVSEDGYTYDKTEYAVKFYMGNSSTTVTITNSGTGEKIDTAEFTHSYTPEKAIVPTDPPVKKSIDGGKPAKTSEFKFKLKAVAATNPMPEGSANGEKVLTIQGEGEAEFGVWYYTKVGSYSYTVTEVNTGEAGYTYDKTQYAFTDVVTDDNGKLVVERKMEGGDGESFPFRNTYTAGTTSPDNNNKSNINTGDKICIGLIVAVMMASACGVVASYKKKRK